jgi:hypothetical protein
MLTRVKLVNTNARDAPINALGTPFWGSTKYPATEPTVAINPIKREP